VVVGLEEDKQSFKAVKNMEEYLPKDESFEVEYDNETREETINYNEQVHRGIIKTDGVEKRLIDSLKNPLSLNQDTNVLTEELKEKLEKDTKRFPEEEEAQRRYIFILIIVL